MSGHSVISVRTGREQMVDITDRVRDIVSGSGVTDGMCTVFSMHTTAGITINENADPDVKTDLLYGLDRAFPDRDEYRHAEGNSHAHLRTSCVGPSVNIIVSDGRLVLGTWQGVFLCEFDGPRTRSVAVKVWEC
ncbi:secondary thiamine-phosphate synthase enzyme YjbQ [Candidatus Methanoprimaticola sp. MG2]|uniref:secondary thiamine-phosphate synthase enzyme YjbQ n=1 Tax=Candidatus Methanoprimaticola sp. MG2 TaxID=3228838 RepID=UPI0039C6F24D